MALNSYMTSGGDGCGYLKEGFEKEETYTLVRDAIVRKMERDGVVERHPEPRMINTELKVVSYTN